VEVVNLDGGRGSVVVGGVEAAGRMARRMR